MSLFKHSILIIGISGLLTGVAFAESSRGWFSGISALPYTTLLNPQNGFATENVFALKNRPNLIGGAGEIPLAKNWNMLGRLGTVKADHPWLNDHSNSSLLDGSMPYDQIGLGISYDLGSHLLLQGNWDRYQFKYNHINGENGIDLLTIGLKYRF